MAFHHLTAQRLPFSSEKVENEGARGDFVLVPRLPFAYNAAMDGSCFYYYLDCDGTPRGPYTFEKILALRKAGVVMPNTLVRKEDEKEWKTLESLEKSPALPSFEENSDAEGSRLGESCAYCPHCRRSILKSESRCAGCCPNCGFIWRAESDSFLSLLEKARKQLWCFEGRSTRRELLAVFAVVFLVQIALIPLALFRGLGESAVIWLAGELVVSSALLPVAARRLNDAGKSPAWLWSNVVFTVSGLTLLVWKIGEMVERLHQFFNLLFGKDFSDSCQLEMWNLKMPEEGCALLGDLALLEMGAFVFVLIKGFMDLILLVQLASPGMPGANEHGPCPKQEKENRNN